ncbi:MAG: rhodanese-like domain-containing protein [bacterium]
MKKKIFNLLLFSLFIFLFNVSFLMNFPGIVEAFDQITAQEAYNMVKSGQATILDVRTLEEYTFVGSPALDAGGEPIAYLIPWKLFDGIDENGKTIYKDNPDFDALVEQTFGSRKSDTLIVICAIGVRSTYAADRLEQLGFTTVYEVDNKLKEMSSPQGTGGLGGLQGSNYQAETNGYFYGYRGYPGRLPSGSISSSIKVATVTEKIENENDSVSWMDTGLPITQKVDPKKIPKLKKVETPVQQTTNNSSWIQSIIPVSYTSYQTMPYLALPSYSSQGTSYSSPSITQNWNTKDMSFIQSLFQGSYMAYPWQLQYPSAGSASSSVYSENPRSS